MKALQFNMKNLFYFFLFYFYYFGILWGYVTFTYDSNLNKFVTSQKLIIWNRIMTLIVFLTFIKMTLFMIGNWSNSNVFKISVIRDDIPVLISIAIYFYVLAISSNINQKFLKLINFSRIFFVSINLSDYDQKEITKKFILIFINDVLAYVVVFYLIKTIVGGMGFSRVPIVIMTYILILGFKLLTTSYIFALLTAAQLISKINRDVNLVLQRKLENLAKLALLHDEVIEFVRSIHSFSTFLLLVTFLSNSQEVVDGVRKYYIRFF